MTDAEEMALRARRAGSPLFVDTSPQYPELPAFLIGGPAHRDERYLPTRMSRIEVPVYKPGNQGYTIATSHRTMTTRARVIYVYEGEMG